MQIPKQRRTAYLVALDQAIAAAKEAVAALEAMAETLTAARKHHLDDASLLEILDELMPLGLSAARTAPAAFRAYEQALSSYRAQLFRGLVDEGRSFSEIGQRTGVSRQVVARLYRSVKEPPLT